MSMHVPPQPRARDRHGLDLGARSMSIGFPNARAIQLGGPASPQRKPARELQPEAQGVALAEILANPVSVESGTWGEALAEMLTLGLRGNATAQANQAALDREANRDAREMKLEDAQRSSLADALANFDPANPAAAIDRLRNGAPEQAFDLASRLVSGARRNQPDALTPEQEAFIATLPPDQQGLARMNPQAFVSGMLRHRFPAPSSRAGVNAHPPVPDGFELD